MVRDPFDVIVVGARCAGAPTAMLLAREGHRVLLVDRDTFPSDTLSTHLIHPPGVAALERWGLFDRMVATESPPIHTYAFDFGPFTIVGSPGTSDAPFAYAPRRTVFDKLLVDAASEAGAEVREGFAVEEILTEDGRVTGIRGRGRGRTVTERARVVVGADGRHSVVARAVRPDRYHEKPPLLAAYYSYWSGLPMSGRFESYVRPKRGWAAWPTNDGLTLVICGWPYAEFEANRRDIEENLLATFELALEWAERIRGATRESRISGASVPNYFHKPYGPGWALVGDAGYNKDFITAQGMQDAFRDAELCATALHRTLGGREPFGPPMEEYPSARDEASLAMFEFTTELASLEPPDPDMQKLLAAIAGNREAMDGFVRVCAGVTSPAEFFSPGNVGVLMSAVA